VKKPDHSGLLFYSLDRAGFWVASAGDVNGDGFDDILTGAYLADHGGKTDAGETYVVFIRAAGP
jgi:hypothetical protein